MAKAKTFTPVDEVKSFFPEASAKKVERILRRATETAIRSSNKQIRQSMASPKRTGRIGGAAGTFVAKEFTKALKRAGAELKGRPSVRERAPDTGGRPFHFGHSAVSTGGRSGGSGKAAGGQKPNGGPRAATAKKGRQAASEAASAPMSYIEREAAVEAVRRNALGEIIGGPGSSEASSSDGR